jgi:O-antigen/teichoic acid export membrane protein
MLLPQWYLMGVSFAGIYLLQRWYGSQQQGYYALALQWSTIALIFTNAGVWIFWQEIASRNAAGDRAHTREAYSRYTTLFVFMALALAGWLSATSGTLVELIAGRDFKPAGVALALLAFYPVSQTLGQLTTAALKATERTALFARISLALSVPDLAVTWLLLAPSTASVPGLGLGAAGLAAKMAIFGFASVQVFDWVICGLFGIEFRRVFARRMLTLVAVGTIAWLVLGIGIPTMVGCGVPLPLALLFGSLAYAVALAAILWIEPEVAGLTREELFRGWRWIAENYLLPAKRSES